MAKVLIIVDAQRDFIDGSLAVPTAKDKMRKLGKYILEEGEQYTTVVATLDWHPSTHCSFKENGGTWEEHCVQYTEGASFYQPLYAKIKEKGLNLIFLTKGDKEDSEEYSIFKNGKSRDILMSICDNTNVKQIDVCGIALDYCVAETMIDAVKNGLGGKLALLKAFSPKIENDEKILTFLEDEGVEIVE